MSSIIINGIKTDHISVLDRGFQYGDGLFETIRVVEGKPQYWQEHLDRLVTGCEKLKIPFHELDSLQNEAGTLCRQVNEGVLKITITRGEGGRGYAVPQPLVPTRVLAIFPYPHYQDECWISGICIQICDTRLGENRALAGIKHLNRIEHVLARAEWNDPDIQEGLMMDGNDNIVEGTMSNLFVVKDNVLLTPDLSRCGVKGIMREQIMRIASNEGMTVQVKDLTLHELYGSDELFVCNSLIGIWPARQVNKCQFNIGPVSRRLLNILNGAIYAS